MRSDFDSKVPIAIQLLRTADRKNPGHKHKKQGGVKSNERVKVTKIRSNQQKVIRISAHKKRVAAYWRGEIEIFRNCNKGIQVSKSHRNRSWRSQWTPEPISHTAVHRSGVTARVCPSPTDSTKDRITLENTTQLDLARWDLGKLKEQAVKLWIEGEF